MQSGLRPIEMKSHQLEGVEEGGSAGHDFRVEPAPKSSFPMQAHICSLSPRPGSPASVPPQPLPHPCQPTSPGCLLRDPHPQALSLAPSPASALHEVPLGLVSGLCKRVGSCEHVCAHVCVCVRPHRLVCSPTSAPNRRDPSSLPLRCPSAFLSCPFSPLLLSPLLSFLVLDSPPPPCLSLASLSPS